MSSQFGPRRAVAAVLVAAGSALAAVAALVGAVGLEEALTAWNDQMALLPWGLSRILGITVYLDLPSDSAWWVAAVGGVVALFGLALGAPYRRTGASRPGLAPPPASHPRGEVVEVSQDRARLRSGEPGGQGARGR